MTGLNILALVAQQNEHYLSSVKADCYLYLSE